jgi:hypothetical protein
MRPSPSAELASFRSNAARRVGDPGGGRPGFAPRGAMAR